MIFACDLPFKSDNTTLGKCWSKFKINQVICLNADLKVKYETVVLKIVGNSESNVQITLLSSDLLRSRRFGLTCFGSFDFYHFG